MEYTTNYNLKKPEGTDPVLVGDLNDNSDIIDTALEDKEDTSNKTQDIETNASSTDKYPSAKAVADYVEDKEDKGKIKIGNDEYTVAISSTDAGTAGYLTFVVGA